MQGIEDDQDAVRRVIDAAAAIRERPARKAAFVAMARAEFVPSRRASCAICGRFPNLTHAHHTEPLAMQFDRGRSEANHDHVWLCPTHHTAVHILIGQMGANGTIASQACAGAVIDLSEDNIEELRLAMEIAKKAWR